MSRLAAQPGLDLEAARGADVLEVDAGEHRRDGLHGRHDLVGVLGVEADRERVDAGEPLEQGGLALHDRQRGERPDVAQAEHRRAVADHGHGVALDREAAGVVGVLGDRDADPRHAGGVDEREVVAVADRHLRLDARLAAEVHQEGAVADLADLDAGQRPRLLDQVVRVPDVAGGAGEVDLHARGAGRGDVERGDDAAAPLDRRGEAR
ncbi:hypothetical protein GCM10025868_11600 [Angustibacter aerolatus]|uniref:Uncharacterized protein n=1 Tax=Angustibacter aerolatus TaxID=1162965 RepID=A0ABQ6JFE0_9ACTN|nr:hypothetical protein GCM10025868_11600 [Angustibacter aerolatus]